MAVTLTSVSPTTVEATGGRLLTLTGTFEPGAKHNVYIGSTALAGTWTWDGTSTVLATDTSQVVVGDFIRLDADGQFYRIASVVTDTSVMIENLLGLTIPSGAGGSSFVDISAGPEIYSGIPGQGSDVYPLNTTTMRAYTPLLTAGGPYDIVVVQPDVTGTPSDVVVTTLTAAKPHFKSSVFAMRTTLPPNYLTGPRNMDVLEPV